MPKQKLKTQVGKTKPKKSLKPLIILGAIFIGLTVLGAFLNNYGNNVLVPEGQQEKQQIISAYRGTLTPAYNINTTEPFVISIGTISGIFNALQLATGIELTRIIDIVINNQTVSFPVRLSFEDDLIHVYATIKDKDNQTIGTIVDNDWWAANPEMSSSVWGRNYNSYAFELIDGNKMPVLQILMDKPNEVDIGFSLLAQGLPYYFGINGTIIHYSGFTYQEVQEIRSSTLFKYPSSEYLGVLNKDISKNIVEYPSSNILDDANKKIEFGNSLDILGNVLIAIFGISLGVLVIDEFRKRRNSKK